MSCTSGDDSLSSFDSYISENEDSSPILFRRRKRGEKLVSDTESDTVNELNETQWNWKEVDNVPKVWNYTEVSCIHPDILHRLGNNPNVLDMFNEVLDENFWKMIAVETNRYAHQNLNNKKYKKKKSDHKWVDTDGNELKIYFALCILMTQMKKPKVRHNWSKRRIMYMPIFEETMPYDRFESISRFLHFSNNETAERGDRLSKIKNVVTYLNDKFQKMYKADENLSLDESLIKFRGRLSYVQFIPKKRARFGIKFYKLCESKSGYCLAFQIYRGQDKKNEETPASESVVLGLTEKILGKGYTLYLDSWYSSPKLYLKLWKKKKCCRNCEAL